MKFDRENEYTERINHLKYKQSADLVKRDDLEKSSSLYYCTIYDIIRDAGFWTISGNPPSASLYDQIQMIAKRSFRKICQISFSEFAEYMGTSPQRNILLLGMYVYMFEV